MNRPYVVCHMLTSIDGKVTGKFLNKEECLPAIEKYYEIHRNAVQKDFAFACGRITMEGSFTKGYYPDLSSFKNENILLEDNVILAPNSKYAIAFDRFGRLGWTNNYIIDEDIGYHESYIIEVLTEKTPNEYLGYLKNLNIAYIFAGTDDINIKVALEKLYHLFGIKLLYLEGGSIINGAFIKEDMIDEISLVMVPLTGQTNDKPLFYESEINKYSLISLEKGENSEIIIKYKRDNL